MKTLNEFVFSQIRQCLNRELFVSNAHRMLYTLIKNLHGELIFAEDGRERYMYMTIVYFVCVEFAHLTDILWLYVLHCNRM